MAATRRQHKNQKESAWVPPLQRDPGPWNRLLLNWLATLAIIMVFGLVMLYSASYTTGYLRMGDSLHYIKQQAICMAIGIGCMVVMSYVDHRFLRWASKPLYWVVLAMLAVTLTFAPLNGRRWIRLGGLTLQTSEVAKFEMILLSSHLAASAPQIGRFSPSLREKIKPKDWLFIRIVRQLIVPVLPLVPVVLLLFLEPHMSGIVLTTAIVGTILLLGGSGLFLLVFQHSLLVISGGFALGKGDGTGGAAGQAVAKAVAVVVPHELCLAVHHSYCALVTGICAGTAAVALFFVYSDYFSYHNIVPFDYTYYRACCYDDIIHHPRTNVCCFYNKINCQWSGCI